MPYLVEVYFGALSPIMVASGSCTLYLYLYFGECFDAILNYKINIPHYPFSKHDTSKYFSLVFVLIVILVIQLETAFSFGNYLPHISLKRISGNELKLQIVQWLINL